jgi:hypothetical protein
MTLDAGHVVRRDGGVRGGARRADRRVIVGRHGLSRGHREGRRHRRGHQSRQGHPHEIRSSHALLPRAGRWRAEPS